MKTKKDLEYKDWEFPLQNDTTFPDHQQYLTNKCTGKNVTDAVEALTCALYLSTKCFKTCLDWINDIQLVPIRYARELYEKFSYNIDYTLRRYRPLDDYGLLTTDHVKDLFLKYFKVEGQDVPTVT
jgi:hypothetical protein